MVRESQGSAGQYVLTGMQSNSKKHLLLVDPEGVVSAFLPISLLVAKNQLSPITEIACEVRDESIVKTFGLLSRCKFGIVTAHYCVSGPYERPHFRLCGPLDHLPP